MQALQQYSKNSIIHCVHHSVHVMWSSAAPAAQPRPRLSIEMQIHAMCHMLQIGKAVIFMRNQSPKLPQSAPRTSKIPPKGSPKPTKMVPKAPSGPLWKHFRKKVANSAILEQFRTPFWSSFLLKNNKQLIRNMQRNHIDFLRVFFSSLRVIEGGSRWTWNEPARSNCM